jgi:hypothetical protein
LTRVFLRSDDGGDEALGRDSFLVNFLWKFIEREAKSARRTKAVIAYVTKELSLRFKAGDVLIADATDGAIASGRTSASILRRLHGKKVSLYSHSGLHAKFVIFDSVLFASSANLSDSSLADPSGFEERMQTTWGVNWYPHMKKPQ